MYLLLEAGCKIQGGSQRVQNLCNEKMNTLARVGYAILQNANIYDDFGKQLLRFVIRKDVADYVIATPPPLNLNLCVEGLLCKRATCEEIWKRCKRRKLNDSVML